MANERQARKRFMADSGVLENGVLPMRFDARVEVSVAFRTIAMGCRGVISTSFWVM